MRNLLCSILIMYLIINSNYFYNVQIDEMRFSDGYNGSTYERSEALSVSYATKEESETAINGNLPLYYNAGSYTNTCANTAGAITLGYYDRTYTNLIENFTSARKIGNRIIYYAQSDEVQNVIDTLYVSMGTNSNGQSGTTISGFKNGLKSYVNGQGYSITYNGIGAYSSFSTTKYIDAITSEIPVTLFVSGYILANLTNEADNADTYKLDYYSGDHVVVGCGIKTVSYYNESGGLIKKYDFLKIASGYYLEGIKYLMLNDYVKIVDSYSIKIY